MTDSRRLGQHVECSTAGAHFKAFIPPPLPPVPELDLGSLEQILTRAARALGKLNAIADDLPNIELLLYYYIRKEAVLSSQIEGTQSSLSDLLLFESDETPSTPLDDVVEVSSYVAALQFGLNKLDSGFPISLRLLREMHGILLAKGRGSTKQPGEFRSSQNWIGGSHPGNATFIPPPPERIMECLDLFEKYIHTEPRHYSTLIDAGLLHVQFETIHPFLDGNGRVGRLLIALFLVAQKELNQPVLYLSLFFKNNRNEYYERLNAVRNSGDWENWLVFFLQGVTETAEQVVNTTRKINSLFAEDKLLIDSLKRPAARAHKVFDELCSSAISNTLELTKTLDMTAPTARAALNDLASLGIVQNVKGAGKERIYVYANLIKLLEQGAEPIEYDV